MTLMISLPGTYGRPGSTSHGGKTLPEGKHIGNL